MDTGGCPSLTSLDENQDTFETFLLCLLHAFTRNQREEEAGSRVELNVSLGSGFLEISPSALSSLSPEQVQTLLTSNSVNYDAVQQIMAQKQHHHQQRGRNDPQGEPQEPTSSSSSDMAAQNGSPVLQQVLGMQFTQEQLKQIQIQVNELLRSQHVSLPPDLTPEQQQQLIQTLIWKQIHMQGPLQTQGNGGQKSTIVSLLKREETDTVTPTPSQAPSQAPPVTESASLQKSVQMQVSTSQQMDSPQQPLQSTAVLGASLTPAPAVLNPVIVPSTAFRSSLTKPSPAPLPKSTPPPLTSPTAITPTLTSPSQSPAPSISSPVTIIPSGPTVVTRRRKDTTKTKKEEPKK